LPVPQINNSPRVIGKPPAYASGAYVGHLAPRLPATQPLKRANRFVGSFSHTYLLAPDVLNFTYNASPHGVDFAHLT
jgi:hypothetical protein